MSIRNLTIRLREEAEELRRRRQFELSRAQNLQETPAPSRVQPPSRPLPVRNEAVSAAAKQMRLKKREEPEPWRIPGGIAARFGRQTLQQAQPMPVAQPAPEKPKPEIPPGIAATTHSQPTQKSERDAREEATRITIELQSH